MKAFRIRLIGKRDKFDEDYYFTTTQVPVSVDLSNTVIHFYPDEAENGEEFGGELVIRHYTRKDNNKVLRRRRRRNKVETPEPEPESTDDADDGFEVTDDD